jgi:hypothetical protein
METVFRHLSGGTKESLRPPHTLRFDLRLACAVSKRKVKWNAMADTTTPNVSVDSLYD